MKRIVQAYVTAVGAHIICVILYFATERVYRETSDFVSPSLLGWFLFPFVRVFEWLVDPATFERLAFVVLGCNALAWAAVISAVMLASRAFLFSAHARS